MQYPAKLIRNNCSYTNKRDIANQLNQHFVTVGPNLANSLPKSNDDPCKYIHDSPVSSFVMTSVAEYQVQCLFNGLDGSKTSISVLNTLIRMASSILSPLFTTIYNEYGSCSLYFENI